MAERWVTFRLRNGKWWKQFLEMFLSEWHCCPVSSCCDLPHNSYSDSENVARNNSFIGFFVGINTCRLEGTCSCAVYSVVKCRKKGNRLISLIWRLGKRGPLRMVLWHARRRIWLQYQLWMRPQKSKSNVELVVEGDCFCLKVIVLILMQPGGNWMLRCLRKLQIRPRRD